MSLRAPDAYSSNRCAWQEAKQRAAAAQKLEDASTAAEVSGAQPGAQPSLLKLLAASSKEPAAKGALAQAVRNLVREVRPPLRSS